MLSSFGKIEMTKLSQLTGRSHDIFTKNLLLNNELDDDKKLWESIKPLLRNYENENKGTLMLNFHYTDDSGISIPLGYEIVTKTEDEWNEKYQSITTIQIFNMF